MKYPITVIVVAVIVTIILLVKVVPVFQDLFSSFGSGLRIRNENLIFGTIELKGFYFPRTNQQVSPWNFSLITNLRYKYNSNFIEKPNYVEIN